MSLTPEQREARSPQLHAVLAGTPARRRARGGRRASGSRCAAVRCASACIGVGGQAPPCSSRPTRSSRRSWRSRHQPTAARQGRRVARRRPATARAALRGLAGDDPEGEARGGRARLAALHARRHRGRVHGGEPARALREDDGVGTSPSCERIARAARKNRRVYEVGHQRFYWRVYQAAHEGIVKAGLLGELYHARLAWHRNGSWRRHAELPSPDYDALALGPPELRPPDQLAALQSTRAATWPSSSATRSRIAEWFLDATATAAVGSGGVFRFKDGRGSPTTPTRRSSTRADAPSSSPSIGVERVRQLLRGLLHGIEGARWC